MLEAKWIIHKGWKAVLLVLPLTLLESVRNLTMTVCLQLVLSRKTTLEFNCESILLRHIFQFLVRWRPLVDVVVITASKGGSQVKEGGRGRRASTGL